MGEFEVPPFRQLCTPAEAARLCVDWYGPGAKRLVALTIWLARDDGRADDANFWMAVLARLYHRDLDNYFLSRAPH